MPTSLPPSGQAQEQLQVFGVVQAAADRLREAVFSGELAPGSPVTEALVAGRFHIARPSAKAAIEKLTAEGLLERHANRSARVLKLDAESVHDIYRTRMWLEGVALRELATRRHAPESAHVANDQIRRLGREHPSEIITHDLDFHLAIVDALDSPRMGSLYRRMASEVRLCMAQVQGRALLPPDIIGDEHAQILQHLATGHGELAVEVLHVHLERAQSLLAEAIVGAAAPEPLEQPKMQRS